MTTTLLTAVLTAALAAGPVVTLDAVGDWHTGYADIGGSATCTGGAGALSATLTDPADPAAYATVHDPIRVVCDGRSHSWATSVFGNIGAPGGKTVRVQLTAPNGTATATRTVDVR